MKFDHKLTEHVTGHLKSAGAPAPPSKIQGGQHHLRTNNMERKKSGALTMDEVKSTKSAF
jgi:hypothetical protein